MCQCVGESEGLRMVVDKKQEDTLDFLAEKTRLYMFVL